jgi:chaperone modulatory protein CbpM
MTIQECSVEILDERNGLGLVELVACTRVERHRVVELVEMGLLEPVGGNADQWLFAARDLRRLRTAGRLIDDLGVNAAGAALIVDLLEQREELLHQLRSQLQLLGP